MNNFGVWHKRWFDMVVQMVLHVLQWKGPGFQSWDKKHQVVGFCGDYQSNTSCIIFPFHENCVCITKHIRYLDVQWYNFVQVFNNMFVDIHLVAMWLAVCVAACKRFGDDEQQFAVIL